MSTRFEDTIDSIERKQRIAHDEQDLAARAGSDRIVTTCDDCGCDMTHAQLLIAQGVSVCGECRSEQELVVVA